MDKASKAVSSARLLLDAGDIDGACNRAYYAMFDAARAALLWADAPVEPDFAKTHRGLLSTFSLHLVKTGKLPVDFGKALNRAAEIRLVADYSGEKVTKDKGQRLVEQASSFVETVRTTFEPSG